MKNKKFLSMLMVVVLMMSFAITGCAKKITPKEAAQVWWEIAFADITNASKLNMKDADAKAMLDTSNESNIATLKSEYNAQGLTATSDQIKEVYDAINGLSKKATVSIEEVSNDGKTAQVKFKSNYIDMVGIATEAVNDAIQTANSSGDTSKTALTNSFIDNLVDGIKNAKFSDDTKELNYTFVMKDNIWQPQDQVDFSTKVGTLIAGQA